MRMLDFGLAITILPKKCPKHGCHLIKRGNLPPFCPKCQAEKIAAEKAAAPKKFAISEVHDYLKDASLVDQKETFKNTFQNFKHKPRSLEDVVWRKAARIAKEYATQPQKKANSIFFGKSGTGKTHLAMSILNYVNENSRQKCLFISIPSLVQANRAWIADPTSSNWSEQFTKERVEEANLLVVDDLGAESASGDASNFVQTVIFNIYDSNQRIITTTNLSSSQIRSTYDNRILSRIEQNALGHVIDFSKLADKRVSLEDLEG